MLTFRAPYGLALNARIDSLKDPSTGQFMTPVFAAGDIKAEQDDGVGFDNYDGVGTEVLNGTIPTLAVSAAETSVLPTRYFQVIDQTVPKAWLDYEFKVVTINSHLAAEPNGCLWAGFLQAVAAGTATLGSTAPANTSLRGCTVIVTRSGVAADVGAIARIGAAGYDGNVSFVATLEANWSRTPTGTASTIWVEVYPDLDLAARAQVAAAAALTAYDVATVADIGVEVEAILAAARSELAGVPAANASLTAKITWLAMMARNAIAQDNDNQEVHNDAGDVIAEAATTRVGSTFRREKFGDA